MRLTGEGTNRFGVADRVSDMTGRMPMRTTINRGEYDQSTAPANASGSTLADTSRHRASKAVSKRRA
jgi:hypothetical protein